ncbi:MAG: hypothetical protein M1297_02320 [Nitrospirae bacterium]|nr:hypothetical protein [Nitrospirota bacterium]
MCGSGFVMPQLWVVAGPNGAGKTTIAERWLASRIPVISPDTLAGIHGLSPLQAGKMAIREQEKLLSSRSSFAVDTTFSGNRELEMMRRAKAAGYKVNLIFIFVFRDPPYAKPELRSGFRAEDMPSLPKMSQDDLKGVLQI